MVLIHFIFPCFCIFAIQNIRIQIIWCKKTCCSEDSLQSEYLLKIFSYWHIFVSKYSFRSEYSQNLKRIKIRFIFAYIRFEPIIAAHPAPASLHLLTREVWGQLRLVSFRSSEQWGISWVTGQTTLVPLLWVKPDNVVIDEMIRYSSFASFKNTF